MELFKRQHLRPALPPLTGPNEPEAGGERYDYIITGVWVKENRTTVDTPDGPREVGDITLKRPNYISVELSEGRVANKVGDHLMLTRQEEAVLRGQIQLVPADALEAARKHGVE